MHLDLGPGLPVEERRRLVRPLAVVGSRPLI